MKFDPDLAAIHGYLCADGYVISNPPTQKHKYYVIGLRNTNNTLLEDFQQRFERVFGVRPIITKDGRCRIQNKGIYHELTRDFTYYSDKWNFPILPKKLLKYWLRAYFDCDGWVRSVKAKDRKIGLDSINKNGIFHIRSVMKDNFDIKSSVKNRVDRNIWSLTICGRDNLKKFDANIGFLHPNKASKLQEALDSYVNYNWKIPDNKTDLIDFIDKKGRVRNKRNEIRIFSIIKPNLISLNNKLKHHNTNSQIFGPWLNNSNREYYCLVIKKQDFDILKRR